MNLIVVSFLVSLSSAAAFLMPSALVGPGAWLLSRRNPINILSQRHVARFDLGIPHLCFHHGDLRRGKLAIFSSLESRNGDSSNAVELATLNVKNALRECILEFNGGQDLLAESLATLTVRHAAK
jgi:hypothetical protein